MQKVDAVDGGNAGLALLPAATDRKPLIMDAIDFGMAPKSLAMFRDEQVPAYLTAKKLSLHQTSFLKCWHCRTNRRPVIGDCADWRSRNGPDDYGGSLTPQVKAQLMPAVCLSRRKCWRNGVSPPLPAALPRKDLNHYSLCMERYEG
ncbi:hypothetical protein KCP77_14815 [Salmonella enterica subsp. enterica]|nr:hypothetical protein KCP77_14815 [Salmonella enterica subsp. enterica]